MFRNLFVGSVGLVLALVGGTAAPAAMFDVDGAGGPTQTGWSSVGPTLADPAVLGGTDGSINVTVTGFASADGRDRGVAATPQAADNNNNQVPEGTFADLYRDFYFKRNADPVTVAFTGLDANTVYDVTAWSYDSGATGGTAVQQNFLIDSIIVAELDYEGDNGTGVGPDPNTNSLDDYSVMFQLTSDAGGTASFTTTSDGTASQFARLNGFEIVAAAIPIPEPGTLVIGLLSILGMATAYRRR